MDRKHIVVGDAPSCGGAVLSFICHPANTIDGHQKAFIGGRVLCAACNSVGFIAKAGGPYRETICDAETALEGDVVECKCPTPPRLVSTKHNRSWCDDRSGVQGLFDSSRMGSNWYYPDLNYLAHSKTIVDAFVTHSTELEKQETICHEKSDKEIRALVLKMRDRAVYLIGLRLRELDHWNAPARAMVKLWFGLDDEKTRNYLRNGLPSCVTILQKFNEQNFVRYSEELVKELGCSANDATEDVAVVCRTDVKTHTIMLKPKFCSLRESSGSIDSIVSTLIHEAAHFDDSFGGNDKHYSFTLSLKLAKNNPEAAKINCDNIAGYVVWETSFDS